LLDSSNEAGHDALRMGQPSCLRMLRQNYAGKHGMETHKCVCIISVGNKLRASVLPEQYQYPNMCLCPRMFSYLTILSGSSFCSSTCWGVCVCMYMYIYTHASICILSRIANRGVMHLVRRCHIQAVVRAIMFGSLAALFPLQAHACALTLCRANAPQEFTCIDLTKEMSMAEVADMQNWHHKVLYAVDCMCIHDHLSTRGFLPCSCET